MTASQYDTAIYNQALRMGISPDLAKIMVAQARYESADYTSNTFNKTNNAFGYKYYPGSKWQAGAGNKSSEYGQDQSVYAKYNSVTDSTGEVVDWLKRRQNEGYFNIADISTPDQYAQALKSADYYGESAGAYTSGLIAKYGLVNIAAVTGGSLLLIVAIIFLFIKSKR
ncbi:MAG: N-acetylmuramidase [Bacteriophage sp.]|nr:MAG: N-acetylmuramidase [Bacteriophage sp.]